MAFADREVQYPGRVKLTPVSGTANLYDMERQEGEVYEEGTILNAENLNNPSITSLRVGESVITDELAGVIQMFAGSTAPNGWLICNGAAVSRSDYATLFRVIGTTYGGGDGSTTFNLPDLRGRFPIGVGNGDAGGHTNHTLAQKGGNENAIVPYHRHGLNGENAAASSANASHTHAAGSGTHYMYRDTDGASSTRSGVGGSGKYTWTSGSVNGFISSTNTASASAAHGHSLAGNSAYAGTSGNTTGANMPPYITLNFIIHAGVPTR